MIEKDIPRKFLWSETFKTIPRFSKCEKVTQTQTQIKNKTMQKSESRLRAFIISLCPMPYKRKQQFDAATEDISRKLKEAREAHDDELVELSQAACDRISEVRAGDSVWVWRDGGFELLTVRSSLMHAEPDLNISFVTCETAEKELVSQSCSATDLEEMRILPATLDDMNMDETLELYQQAVESFDLPNMQFQK